MNAPSQVGRTLGHYRIIEAIGAGGMGVVYRGRDARLDRDIALKLLPPDRFSDAAARKRFRNEALLLSQLNHPNIASIYDFDTQDGIDFLVMELIAGVTLAKKLEDGPLSESETLHISLQILDALREAHRLGIIHRDLKPSNIVIGPSHRVKILDFGLSRIQKDTNSALTESLEDLEHGAGTLPYMAPELLQGKSSDARTDIWSTGVVMYEMSTGHRPFEGKTSYEISSAILGSDPASLPPQLSQGFRGVISRCLTKQSERRYQSVGEVEAALTSVNVQDPHPRSWTRQVGLVAVALLVLVVVIVLLKKHFSATDNLPTEKQLAILSLPVSSDSPEMIAFGDGLNETLTTRLTGLTRSNNLQIIPASEIRSRGIKTLQDANQEFGINLGLEIAIRRSGDMVRVNYSLVDAKTHRQLRADTITAPASDPFALEDRVSNSIMNALELELAPQERRTGEDRGTSYAAAFDYYLQGRGNLQEFEKPENVDRAIAAFNKAVEADPHYAVAFAGLGEAYWQKYDQSHDPSFVERATNACKSAVELKDSAAEGYICLGTVFQGSGQYALASIAFARARELDPTSDQAVVGAASVYQALGIPDKAEETYRRAIEMRPQYWRNYSLLGGFFVSQGQYDKAAEMFRKVIAIAPDSFRGYSNLGGIETYQGQYSDAVSTLQKSIAIRKTGDALSNLGTAYFHMRKFDQSATAFQEAIRFDENNYPLWGNLADAYYYGGHQTESVPAFTKAAELAAQQLSVNSQDASVLAALASYYSMLGDKNKALMYIGRALQSAPRNPEVIFDMAQICNQLGNERETIIWLRKALDTGFPLVQVQDTPSLDNLRSDKDFQNLVTTYEHKGHKENIDKRGG